ncbi:MAG: hypothetical protein ACI379_13565 [Nocardioides sp.]|uniref:hypothetical protein n=1 Tax=Nocardioides sp. TaxID=35761 RepID=UPI003EFF0E26
MSGRRWRDAVTRRARGSEAVPPADPWRSFRSPRPMLVLLDDREGLPPVVLPEVGDGGAVVRLSELDGSVRGRGTSSVLVVTEDRDTLRSLVQGLGRMARARVVSCHLYGTNEPLVVRPAPEWPPLAASESRQLGDGIITTLRFTAPVRARAVLVQVARQALPGGREIPGGGLFLDAASPRPVDGLPVTAKVTGPRRPVEGEAARDVPPDVMVAAQGGPTPVLPTSPITGRAPLVVAAPTVAPYDERLVNPVGWLAAWERPVADVDTLGLGTRLRPAAVAGLRDLQGVRVELGRTPPATVVGLAMAGVPLLTTGSDPALSPALADALAAPCDLDDTLAREERSLAVRRAALETHSTRARARDLAGGAGVRFAGDPSVSVLLSTKRPDKVEFALGQVARQDVEVEVVLATHGFEVDPARVADLLGDRPHRVVPFAADTLFGDVLDGASRAASGDLLLKMDDDDWYSPRFVRDLLLARRYADADLVGTTAEFVYLAEVDRTVRRIQPSEQFHRFVAGGSIMLDRVLLRELGGFRRTRKFVDAQLLRAAGDAGVRVYRTHGLGYLLRREATGHTWEQDVEEFQRPETISGQWPGLRASVELELTSEESV